MCVYVLSIQIHAYKLCILVKYSESYHMYLILPVTIDNSM